jgi:transcriptional regulator with XRE-family HTH domain
MIPAQIRILRKQRGWSQTDLAKQSDLTQGVISRAEDQDYGNLTVNTLVRIAGGFDCAFVGRFVPFSEFAGWYNGLENDQSFEVPSFADDTDPIRETAEVQIGNNSYRQAVSMESRIGSAISSASAAATASIGSPQDNVTNITKIRRRRAGRRESKAGRSTRTENLSVRGVRGTLVQQRPFRIDSMEPPIPVWERGLSGQRDCGAYVDQRALASG